MWYSFGMKIHNPSSLPTIDYRLVKPLQGNLKDLHTEQHDQLLHVLEQRGFTTPLFVWPHPTTGDLYLLDGHQRQRVMTINELSDDGNYEVPYVIVEAPDERTAKEMLLEITSQYGKITQEGLDELLSTAELELDDLDIHFDALSWPDIGEDTLEPVEPSEKDKTPNEPTFTLSELRGALNRFTVATESNAADEFLDWLA